MVAMAFFLTLALLMVGGLFGLASWADYVMMHKGVK
jgi:hypothetical protein